MDKNTDIQIKKKCGPKIKTRTPEQLEELKLKEREYIRNYYHGHKDKFYKSKYFFIICLNVFNINPRIIHNIRNRLNFSVYNV